MRKSRLALLACGAMVHVGCQTQRGGNSQPVSDVSDTYTTSVLTPLEDRIVKIYTGSAYDSIGAFLKEQVMLSRDNQGEVVVSFAKVDNPDADYNKKLSFSQRFLSAIGKLPPARKDVPDGGSLCGFKADATASVFQRGGYEGNSISRVYPKGKVFLRSSVLSVTTNPDIANRFATIDANSGMPYTDFKGSLIFELRTKSARAVHQISLSPDEKEYIIPPGVAFTVISDPQPQNISVSLNNVDTGEEETKQITATLVCAEEIQAGSPEMIEADRQIANLHRNRVPRPDAPPYQINNFVYFACSLGAGSMADCIAEDLCRYKPTHEFVVQDEVTGQDCFNKNSTAIASKCPSEEEHCLKRFIADSGHL